MTQSMSSPRTWGEPYTEAALLGWAVRLPHARGGEPPSKIEREVDEKGLPHARGGEPHHPAEQIAASAVFPTHVGVNRPAKRWCAVVLNVFPTHVGVNRPRRRGRRKLNPSSPRTWG